MNTATRDSFNVDQSGGRPVPSQSGRVLDIGGKLAAMCVMAWLCLFTSTKAEAQDQYYLNQGAQSDNRGNFEKAIVYYTQALAVCPTDAQAFTSRGFDWYRTGDYDRSLADFDQAVANSSTENLPTIYNNRATIESSKGDYDKANADFYRALSVDPNCALSYENLGFLEATCPDPKFRDGKKAFENASRAYQLAAGTDSYYTFGTLAAAYAECGDFEAARAWQAKVVEIAPPSDKQLQTDRLGLYKQDKPYRSAVKSPLQVRSEPAAN